MTRILRVGACAFSVLILPTLRCLAGVQLNVASQSVASSTTTATTFDLDVFLSSPSSGSLGLASYDVSLILTPANGSSAGVGFITSGVVQTSAAHPDLFFGPPFVPGSSTPTDLMVADNLSSGQDTILDGSGLFAAQITVPANAYGSYAISFDTSPSHTALFNGSAQSVSIDAYNAGTLVVSAPEPASIAALAAGAAVLLRRRGRSANV